jgi:thiamine biosynthesis lipoprotein
MVEFAFKDKLFGKEVEIILSDVDAENGEIFAKMAYQKGLALQKIFNVFDENSELSNLNKKLGLNKSQKVSAELLEVITKAKYFSELTNGEYDVSLGKLFLARKKKLVEPDIICTYKNIQIDKNCISSDNSDVLIDLGSIAKGYIGDKIADVLIAEGILNGYVDARGDLRAFGDKMYQIGLAHPREKNSIILELNLSNCGIATSGDYNQFYGDYSKSHIFKSKDLISVTAIAPTLMEADVFASVIFVSNRVLREKLLNENKQIKAITIDKELNIKYYNGSDKLVVNAKNNN